MQSILLVDDSGFFKEIGVQIASRLPCRLLSASSGTEALTVARKERPDLIFLDADKRSLPQYLESSLLLSHPGTIIIADNVVRDGKVIEPDNPDPDIQGVRRLIEMMASNPRLSAPAIPTVGARGYDGFAMAVVLH